MHNTCRTTSLSNHVTSLTQYRNMVIWILWNIDIPSSLNPRDSFLRRNSKIGLRQAVNQILYYHHQPSVLSSMRKWQRRYTRKVQFGNFRSFVTLTLDRIEVILFRIPGWGPPTHQIRSKSEKLFVDVQTDGHMAGRTDGHTWVPIY